MFCHNIKPRSWSVHVLLMFFLTTVYSKVGIVTKHFTSGHLSIMSWGGFLFTQLPKKLQIVFHTVTFPYCFVFCTVVNK